MDIYSLYIYMLICMVNMVTFLIHETESTFKNKKKISLRLFLNLILKMPTGDPGSGGARL